MNIIDKITSYLPTIEEPKKLLSLRGKVYNTLLVIALYTVLASIPLFGISTAVSARLEQFLWLLDQIWGP